MHIRRSMFDIRIFGRNVTIVGKKIASSAQAIVPAEVLHAVSCVSWQKSEGFSDLWQFFEYANIKYANIRICEYRIFIQLDGRFTRVCDMIYTVYGLLIWLVRGVREILTSKCI